MTDTPIRTMLVRLFQHRLGKLNESEELNGKNYLINKNIGKVKLRRRLTSQK